MKKLQIRNSSEEYYCGKIVCVGRNYVEHAKELGNELPEFPLIFLKPASSIILSGENVIHPSFSQNLHYEAELVLLIGEEVSKADKEKADKAIAGYTVGLDMTARDVQNELAKKGHPWTIAKCFDASAVLSDFILKKDYELNFDESIILKLNGEVRQNSQLNKMIFKPADIVSYISGIMKLEKGDLIFTGTPAGVGKVIVGDKLVAEITSVGKLETNIT